MTLRTERLLLRQWKPEDYAPFAALNADPRVREFFPGLLTTAKSDETARFIQNEIAKNGWGLWAAELLENGQFIGFIGIHPIPFTAHFTPAVEIGWRLAFEAWGKGYATEGAKAALGYGFETLRLKEIVAITPLQNLRSWHVMEKIGMTRDPKDDFDHPKIEEGHPLRRHLLARKISPFI